VRAARLEYSYFRGAPELGYGTQFFNNTHLLLNGAIYCIKIRL